MLYVRITIREIDIRDYMKNLLVLSILLIAPAVFAADNALYQGNFECVGKEINKPGEFKMNMVVQKTGETYAVHTHSLTDDYKGIGVGIYTHANNTLTVGFGNPDNAKETGICIFTEKSPKTLEGFWTYIGEQKIEKVTCKKMN